jgi:hypothetical protein
VDVLTGAGMVAALVWVSFLCRWSYRRGRLAGRQIEAAHWCDAFEQIKVPNWQNVPVEDEKQRSGQEANHRMYVQVFRAAKEALGQEMVSNRIEALRVEGKSK